MTGCNFLKSQLGIYLSYFHLNNAKISPFQRRPTGFLPLFIVFAALCVFGQGKVFGQNNFVAIPPQSASKYHIDFEKNFFASPETEKADRANYYRTLAALETRKGRVANSADNLLSALQQYDKALVDFMRHYTYLYLRNAVNTKDRESRDAASEMDAEFSKRTAFVQQELIQIDKRALDNFSRQRPGLKIYLFLIEAAQRYRPYTLSLKEEEALSFTAPSTLEWQYDLYDTLLGRTVFETIKPGGENTDPRAMREAGFKALYKGYASQRDLYAFALINLVKAQNRVAQIHHFEDAPERIYLNSFWTKAEVKTLLQEVEKASDVYKRYQRSRADFARKQFGYTDVNLWDIRAGSNANNIPRFSIEDATRTIREALAPLGPEYARELAALLDPSNGRMDIVPGENRRGGGFSKGFPGVTTVFFSGGFRGFYNDMRVLTHESTHAIHRQLMKNNNVLPNYAEGPHYLFESFAILNELLLPDYLYEHETDPARRRYFLEQFFEGKGMTMFSVAMEETIELGIYEGVQKGEIKSADDLDALTKQIGRRYSIWPEKHDELKMDWMMFRLFYEDPLYDINYVYGALLALKYYEMYLQNPKEFSARYIALLKNGFDAPPAVLLKRFLNIDLHDPRLVTDAVKFLEKKLDQLEAEYSKTAPRSSIN